MFICGCKWTKENPVPAVPNSPLLLPNNEDLLDEVFIEDENVTWHGEAIDAVCTEVMWPVRVSCLDIMWHFEVMGVVCIVMWSGSVVCVDVMWPGRSLGVVCSEDTGPCKDPNVVCNEVTWPGRFVGVVCNVVTWPGRLPGTGMVCAKRLWCSWVMGAEFNSISGFISNNIDGSKEYNYMLM